MTENIETHEFVLRHARSEANEQKVLISDPEIGTKAYGITEFGRTQVRKSITAAKEAGLGRERPVVYICSPFLRARETAEEAQKIIMGIIKVDERLSERWMGQFDGQNDGVLMSDIWPADAAEDTTLYCLYGLKSLESPNMVAARMQAVFRDARVAFPGYDIIYVSHGDPIQIALTAEQGINPGKHRDRDHFGNAQVSKLK